MDDEDLVNICVLVFRYLTPSRKDTKLKVFFER